MIHKTHQAHKTHKTSNANAAKIHKTHQAHTTHNSSCIARCTFFCQSMVREDSKCLHKPSSHLSLLTWDLSQSRSRTFHCPSRGSHMYMLCSASDCVCMSMSVCLYMCVSLRVYVPIPSASLKNIHLSAHLNANPLTTSVGFCRTTLAL